jgi:hypothetical protein
MAFPEQPTNGQQADVNGVIYIYSTTLTAWTVLTNTGANVSANNVAATNTISTVTICATGNITGNYILGNGSLLTGVSTSGSSNINNGTSNVTVVSSGGNVTVGVAGTGNVAVFADTGEYVTGVVSASGNITGSNLLTAGLLSATGTATVGNVLTAGLLSATGNATVGNILTPGGVSATGNIQGNYILGNGSQLTGVASGNSSIIITQTTISANYTIATGQNGLSVGPMTTANNVQVSVADGQRWIIL